MRRSRFNLILTSLGVAMSLTFVFVTTVYMFQERSTYQYISTGPRELFYGERGGREQGREGGKERERGREREGERGGRERGRERGREGERERERGNFSSHYTILLLSQIDFPLETVR